MGKTHELSIILRLLINLTQLEQFKSCYEAKKKPEDPVWTFYRLFFEGLHITIFAIDRLPSEEKLLRVARTAWQQLSLSSQSHIKLSFLPDLFVAPAPPNRSLCEAELRAKRNRMLSGVRKRCTW